MQFEIKVKNVALEREERTGSNYTAPRELKSDDATIADVTGGTITLNEAILDRISIEEGDPLEIFGGNAAGEYTIDTINSDTEFTVNESISDASDGDVEIYSFTELPLPDSIARLPSISRESGDVRETLDPEEELTFRRDESRLLRETLNKKETLVDDIERLVEEGSLDILTLSPALNKDSDDLKFGERLKEVMQDYDEFKGVEPVDGVDTKTVSLPQELPNADYHIKGLVLDSAPGTAGHPWVTNKTTDSFDLKFADTSYSGNVEWTIELD